MFSQVKKPTTRLATVSRVSLNVIVHLRSWPSDPEPVMSRNSPGDSWVMVTSANTLPVGVSMWLMLVAPTWKHAGQKDKWCIHFRAFAGARKKIRAILLFWILYRYRSCSIVYRAVYSVEGVHGKSLHPHITTSNAEIDMCMMSLRLANAPFLNICHKGYSLWEAILKYNFTLCLWIKGQNKRENACF